MSDDPPRNDKSTPSGRNPLRIYVDADVLFAGASSPSEHSASQVVLTLSEITLIEGVTSEFAVEECRRNLQAKIPDATGDFDRLVNRSLTVRKPPSREALLSHVNRADWKDLSHLVSALEANCRYLTTYNVEDYEPGHPDLKIVRPGTLVRRVREKLSSL